MVLQSYVSVFQQLLAVRETLVNLVQNMHCGILKMIATSGFLAALDCTKFVFCRGDAQDPLKELTSPKPPSRLQLGQDAASCRDAEKAEEPVPGL